MAEVAIWNGTSNFQPGQTPLGLYDTDVAFQADADKVAKYCAVHLGYPMLDVELYSGSFYAAFEHAITVYGNEVFQYKIRENYISLEGSDATAGSANNKIVNPSLQRIVDITKNYGTEAGVGGLVTKHTGSIAMTASRQDYDLDQWALDNGISSSIEIRKIFYEAPPAILRYFDPYAGTGTGIQSMMDAFDFGSFSPGVNFLLMPASYDMLKIQAIEFNDQIRRSSYSFELVNNKLRIFPIPKTNYNLKFEYYKVDEKNATSFLEGANKITNIGEVPYANPTYSQINSVGRQWIKEYALAEARHILGLVRGKYETVPVPGSETRLNAADLLADARSEKEALITQLRDTLEQTSRQAQLERKAAESENLRRTIADVPMTIYVG